MLFIFYFQLSIKVVKSVLGSINSYLLFIISLYSLIFYIESLFGA